MGWYAAIAAQDRSHLKGDHPASSFIRNLGLLAHVDAGKTTTTEQMLFRSGSIRTIGRVDEGTTQTDYLDVERRRGISIRMADTSFSWNGCRINLIDTPGHTDFVAEVERALAVLDGAVLIVSAAEGVQSHAETIWQSLRSLSIPTLIFINKIDRLGADPQRVLDQIGTLLTERAVPIQISPLAQRHLAEVSSRPATELIEHLAELGDEQAMVRYLGDDAGPGSARPTDWVLSRLSTLTRQCEVFPVLYGASLRGIGIAELLDAIVDLLPPPTVPTDATPGGIVFKIERDPQMGRVAHVRMYSGALVNRAPVMIVGQSEAARPTRIGTMRARRCESVPCLEAGDIGVVYGLGHVRAGDILGTPDYIPAVQRLAVPVLRVVIRAQRSDEQMRLLAAVEELADEDPHMEIQFVPELREITVAVMGPIQVEILTSLLETRFGLQIIADPPSVIYRETPIGAGEGTARYTFKGLAMTRFRIEAGEAGSGLRVENGVLHDRLYPQFAHEACRAASETLRQGLRGWAVTDAHVRLIDGVFDSVTSIAGDYGRVAPMAVMDALAEAGTRLLEPTYDFRVSVPAELGGQVIGELIRMRAVFDSEDASGGRLELVGTLPVATSLAFPIRFGSLTGGRGIINLRPGAYQPAPPDVDIVRPRVGENPLDRTRYLMYLRGVLNR
jgi:ribosomal protection tetracycline resistance protein